MDKNDVNVWLINTGWSGGSYGVGARMKLSYTRAMITAAIEGKLENVDFVTHPVFGVQVPQDCPDVPNEILNPKDTWADKAAYDAKANELAEGFVKNFEQYAAGSSEDILAAAPKTSVNA